MQQQSLTPLRLSQGGISLGSHTTSDKRTWRQLLQDHYRHSDPLLQESSDQGQQCWKLHGATYIRELVQEKSDLQTVHLYPISCLSSRKSPTLKDINRLSGRLLLEKFPSSCLLQSKDGSSRLRLCS